MTMMYAFMQLDDGTEVVHSEAYDDNGTETVKVYFEQPANARYYKDIHQSEKHNMEKGGKKK